VEGETSDSTRGDKRNRVRYQKKNQNAVDKGAEGLKAERRAMRKRRADTTGRANLGFKKERAL